MSEQIKLPEELQATDQPDDVQIPIDAAVKRTYTPEQFAEIQNKLGMVSIERNRILALAEMGDVAKSLGILKTIHGTTLVTQDALIQAIGYLSRVVADEDKDEERRTIAAKALGYLSEKVSKVNLAAVKVDQTVTNVVMQVDKHRRESFAPGSVVGKAPAKV